MVQKSVRLVCNNEHGTGDVPFPKDEIFDVNYSNARQVRRAAKALAGWGRVNGGDYCEGCMESMKTESEVA